MREIPAKLPRYIIVHLKVLNTRETIIGIDKNVYSAKLYTNCTPIYCSTPRTPVPAMARRSSLRAPQADPDLSDDDIQESRKRKRVSAASSSSHLDSFEDSEEVEEDPEEEDEDGDRASSQAIPNLPVDVFQVQSLQVEYLQMLLVLDSNLMQALKPPRSAKNGADGRLAMGSGLPIEKIKVFRWHLQDEQLLVTTPKDLKPKLLISTLGKKLKGVLSGLRLLPVCQDWEKISIVLFTKKRWPMR